MAEHPAKERAPQVNFTVKEQSLKEEFAEALAKQDHIRDQTQFFQSAMQAAIAATAKRELLEWPLKFVTKPKE